MTICRNIRRLLRPASVALMLAAMPQAGFAQASNVAAQVAEQLKAQGYRQIEVRRSLLGKVVISARSKDHTREIVIDPRNGDLLRDLVRDEDGGNGAAVASVGTREDDSDDDDSSSGSGSSSGSDDSDDDTDSDDDSSSDDDSDSDDDDSDSDSDDD